MITIKNRKPQPFVINVPQQDAIYVQPKQTFDVTEDQYQAVEMQEKLASKDFIVVRMT